MSDDETAQGRIGQVVDGRYKLTEVMAAGAMGEVYRAERVPVGKLVAVKFLHASFVSDSEFQARFDRETRVMSKLAHPNCVSVVDFGVWKDNPYLVMDFVAGTTLRKRLDETHAQTPAQALAIARQVTAGLAHAHEQGIIHRDIKPANIIACVRGGVPDVAKVVDFGLVKDVGKAGATTQTIKGTVGFIAPEVATDPDLVGPGVDLYGLGCVAYYMLTGRPVFEGKTAMEQLRLHVKAPPVPPSTFVRGLDPALEAIVLRCLAKHPRDRFASARELAVALRAVPTADWTDAQAREWWRARREADAAHALLSTEPTRTITVDIGHRA